MAERRKNWFQRQMHRISMRSSSTTYSSGGLFNRTRHNSVYSSPENGLATSTGLHGHINGINGSTPHLQKITLYERLWGRKSRRGSTQGTFYFLIWIKYIKWFICWNAIYYFPIINITIKLSVFFFFFLYNILV